MIDAPIIINCRYERYVCIQHYKLWSCQSMHILCRCNFQLYTVGCRVWRQSKMNSAASAMHRVLCNWKQSVYTQIASVYFACNMKQLKEKQQQVTVSRSTLRPFIIQCCAQYHTNYVESMQFSLLVCVPSITIHSVKGIKILQLRFCSKHLAARVSLFSECHYVFAIFISTHQQ